MWTQHRGESSSFLTAYEKVVHWKHNLFEVPRRKAAEWFVSELSHALESYSDAVELEYIALKELPKVKT